MIDPPRIERSWFWGQIDASGDCWLWEGKASPDGYGLVTYLNKNWIVHRLVWSMLVSDIPNEPEKMVLDHLCKVRNCCNPVHLEMVTQTENMARMRKSRGRGVKRRCHRGHTGEWASDVRGKIICKGCIRERVRDHRERKTESGDAE